MLAVVEVAGWKGAGCIGARGFAAVGVGKLSMDWFWAARSVWQSSAALQYVQYDRCATVLLWVNLCSLVPLFFLLLFLFLCSQ